MKQNLLKTFIAAAAIVLGSTGAMAQDDYETVYTRTAGSETNAWTDTDKEEWSATSFSIDATKGLGIDASAISMEATKTFSITADNAKVRYEIDWHFGSSPYQLTNFTFLQIGDKVRFTWYSDYYVRLTTNGASDATAETVFKGSNTTFTKKVIAIINTATQKIESLTFDGVELADKVVDVINTAPNVVSFGYTKGGNNYSWAVPNYITNITVSQAEQTVSTANYTIKKVCGDIELGTDEYIGVIGSEVTISKDQIIVDGKKYQYVSDDLESVGVIAEGKVYTVNYELVPQVASLTVNYTYNGATVKSESLPAEGLYVGEAYTVPFHYIVVDDANENVYKTTNNTSGAYYTQSVTLEENTVVEKALTLLYADVDVKIIEDLDGSTSDNAGVRASNGSSYNNAPYTSSVSLPAGAYTVLIRAFAKGRGSYLTIGDETVIEASEVSSSAWGDIKKENEVTNGGLVKWNAGPSNTYGYLDVVLVIRTGDATEEVTIGSAGAATYAPKANVLVPEGVTAYTVTVNDDQTSVTITEVNGALQAGKGYVIEGAEGTYSFTYAGDAAVESNANNLIVAEEGGKTAAAADNLYILAQRTDGSVGFSRVKAETTIPAGKAYLDLGASASAKPAFLTIGQPTAVEGVEAAAAAAPVEYISLQGIRTTTPKGGIYIVNGKAVLVK